MSNSGHMDDDKMQEALFHVRATPRHVEVRAGSFMPDGDGCTYVREYYAPLQDEL